MIEKAMKLRRLLNTNSGLRPGDFAVGSAKSRAAARVLAEQKDNDHKRVQIFIVGMGYFKEAGKAIIGQWYQDQQGVMNRTVTMPAEISPEESLRIFGTERNPFNGCTGVYVI